MAGNGGDRFDLDTEDVRKAENLADLARLLRRLRRRDARQRGDSELTYRELAGKAGWSHAVVGEYFTGKALPPTDRFDVLIRLLGATPTELGALATARDRVEERRRSAGQTPARPADAPLVPRELPADVYGFTGRPDQLAELHSLVTARAQSSAMVVAVVSGTAGVGKTALAVHWAHQVRDQFPDGQLYVNLRGFDTSGSAMAPAEAVRGFLDALNVSPQRLPVGLDAQAGLYRSLLSGKRMLILLDNARDAEQVRPLLPGAPGCVVVVTSRNQLPGLVAVEGAHPLALDLLPADEATQLLARRLGPARVAVEPRAVEDIIARCARLPLALAIVAARAATHPGFHLDALAGELHDARDGLDAFAGGDAITDMRAVFSWSYHTLSDEAARLFRLLGLHPGPDIATHAAASLAGVPLGRIRPLLTELTRAHLVSERVPGRFAFHDLLRVYAIELAHTHDTDEERHAAVHRVLDHYLNSAHPASLLLNPYRDVLSPASPVAGVTPVRVAEVRQAMAWFTAEYAILLAVVELAEAHGFDAHTWQLASAIGTFCQRRGHWRDQIAIQSAALAATRRLADLDRQASAHRDLGRAHVRLSNDGAAHHHFRQALDLYGKLGDATGQAHIYNNIADALDRQGRPQDALGHSQQAVDLFRAAGKRTGLAWALNGVGWLHSRLGNYEQAIAYCEEALVLQREIDDRQGQGATWDSLGYAHHHLGHHERALSCYEHAFDLIREVGDRYQQADVLTHLGDTHEASGNPAAARDAWLRALEILDELGHPDADQVRRKLNDLDARSEPIANHAG
ncbi:MAG TPA: tetratricopeptide repeat protein [Pilimelia sp.]|nr:tetratricopeptide repeat protein [Pilimelia sp.]